MISAFASWSPATSANFVDTFFAFTAFDLPTLKIPPAPPPPIPPRPAAPRESMKKKPMRSSVGTNRPASDSHEVSATYWTAT